MKSSESSVKYLWQCLLVLFVVSSFSFELSFLSLSSSSSPTFFVSATSSNQTDCSQFNNLCGPCTDNSDCVFCDGKDDQQCVVGGVFGPSGGNCKDWRWKQCNIDGVWLIVSVAGAIVVVLLIGIVCCVCCCCCDGCKRRFPQLSLARASEIIRAREDQRLLEKHEGEDNFSRTPNTDKHREDMRSKWGIGKKPDDQVTFWLKIFNQKLKYFKFIWIFFTISSFIRKISNYSDNILS